MSTENPIGHWGRRFAALWASQALSLFGSQLVSFALIWHLAQTTGSGTVLAGAALMSLLPQVFLGPLAGALVDRWNRRVVMIMADAGIAAATLALAALFLTGAAQPWHIYALAFLRAIGAGFHGPAWIASTSRLVPERQLTRVQGLNQTLEGALNIGAAPAAALLLTVMPMHGILLLDIGTALIAIALLSIFPIPQPARPDAPPDAQAGWRTIVSDVRAGLRYVWRWSGLRVLLAMGVLFNALLQPALALLPLLVRRMAGSTALTLGNVQAAFGIGAVLGGALLAAWGGFRRRSLTVALGLAGLGAALLAAGLWADAGPAWAAGCLLTAGAMMALIHGSLFAIIQARVAPEMQGRVLALTFSVVGLAVPIGLTAAGPLADAVGPEIWFVCAGIVCAAMGAAAAASPAVRRMDGSPDACAAPERGVDAVV